MVIPALNEEKTIGLVIDQLKECLVSARLPFEIIVVDDGSQDKTAELARARKVQLISHPIPGGYGLSIRDGILKAQYDYVGIIDADNTYPAQKIIEWLEYLDHFDMVVGARTGKVFRESLWKYPMRKIFHWICEFVTGIKIPDVNSGLRIFKKDVVLQFKENFCLGFSFTTTITLAFHLNGYFIKYVPIDYYKRAGKSHVRFIKDTLRTAQIITQAILYYNPIKLFTLLAIGTGLMGLTAVCVYGLSGSFLALIVGQTFLLAAFLNFGMGLIAEILREKKTTQE